MEISDLIRGLDMGMAGVVCNVCNEYAVACSLALTSLYSLHPTPWLAIHPSVEHRVDGSSPLCVSACVCVCVSFICPQPVNQQDRNAEANLQVLLQYSTPPAHSQAASQADSLNWLIHPLIPLALLHLTFRYANSSYLSPTQTTPDPTYSTWLQPYRIMAWYILWYTWCRTHEPKVVLEYCVQYYVTYANICVPRHCFLSFALCCVCILLAIT
jgi:hypothetical protein